MDQQGVVRVSTRSQVAMGGLLVALGVAMGTLLPAAQNAQHALLAGLCALGALMVACALAERLRP